VTTLQYGAEALQEIEFEVRDPGGRIVAITPELERYTRNLHKKLNLAFDILTDFHLKRREKFRLVFCAARLLAGALQVVRQYSRQVP
jgi:peroxiredoxin